MEGIKVNKMKKSSKALSLVALLAALIAVVIYALRRQLGWKSKEGIR